MALFGRYTLLERVGSGGMAEIWRARVTGPAGFEKVLALKKVLPHLVEEQGSAFVPMFIAEAKLAASLVHPNVVQVFDFGEVGREYFIAMEYVPGTNLARLMTRLQEAGQTLPLPCALYVLLEVARGLAYAHSAHDPSGRRLDVVHRDISPQNLLVSYGGEVKIADFGIARVSDSISTTAEGHVRGKLSYMSPEQARGERLDGRADLFSLGVVAFQVLTGRRLLSGTSHAEVYKQILAYPGPNEADLAAAPPQLRDLLRRALQANRDERFEDADELEAALALHLSSSDAITARHTLSALVQHLFSDEMARARLSGDETTGLPPVSQGSPTISVPSARPSTRGKARIARLAVLGLVAASLLAVRLGILTDAAPNVRAAPTALAANPSATATAVALAPTASVAASGAGMTPGKPNPRRTPPPARTGILSVDAEPWGQIFVDGEPTGRETPAFDLVLPEGTHEIRIVNPAQKLEARLTVKIVGGRTRKTGLVKLAPVGAR